MNLKLRKGLAPALALSLLTLAGCSNQSGSTASLSAEQQSAKEVVENYLTDFKDAKLDEADEYVDPDNKDLQLSSTLDSIIQLYELIGADQETIDMIKNLEFEAIASLVQSYTIGEITTDSDNKVTVNVDITGISPDSLDNIQSTDLVAAVTETVGEAAQGGIDSSIFQEALDTVLTTVKKETTETTSAAFTVEEIDGSWLITGTKNFVQLPELELKPEGAADLETEEEEAIAEEESSDQAS